VNDRVHAHVHLAVAGAFPLRVADVLFTEDELVVTEYEYLTPLDIARGRVHEAGKQARERVRESGPADLVAAAERTHRLGYADLERVRLYESGPGRPKLAVDPAVGPPYAYRIHAPVDLEALAGTLRPLGDRQNFEVTVASALGFSPVNSLRRFLADR